MDEVLSWTSADPRTSILIGPTGTVQYRFTTETDGVNTTTTVWRVIKPSREEKIAKFEWDLNASLGRATLGRMSMAISELLRPHPTLPGSSRYFVGPLDGRIYTWFHNSATGECTLHDPHNRCIAFYRPVRPTRYHLGDVYGELHFCAGQTTGVLLTPPLMEMISATAMAYRVLLQRGV